MNKNILIVVVILLAVLAVAIFLGKKESAAESDLDPFAQCLTEKGAVFYGTYSCPYCLEQKNMFGKSFQYVDYVECTQDVIRCNSEKIESVPTWIFGDGERVSGRTSLEKLSEITGCVLFEE